MLFVGYAGIREEMRCETVVVGTVLVEHLRHAAQQAVEIFRRCAPLVFGERGKAQQVHILHVG